MKTIFKSSSLVTLVMGALIAFVAGFNPAVGAVAALGAQYTIQTVSQLPVGSLFVSAVDVSSLAAYPGEYEDQLFSTLINSLDVAKDITVIPNVKNKLNLTKLKVKKGARPYSGTHEPGVGDLNYTPRVLNVEVGKRDLLIDPEDYRATFMAQKVGPGSGASKKDIPFAEYVWNEVMKSLAAEINDEVAYHGLKRSALTITAYSGAATYAVGDYISYGTSPVKWYRCVSATTAGQSPDTHAAKWLDVTARIITEGFGSIIASEITATNLTATATGAITDGATAKAAFKKLFRAHSDAYKAAGLITYCSYTDYEFLLDGLTETTKYTRDDASEGKLYLPETGKKNLIQPVTWLNGSRRLICTPAENLLMGTDLLSDLNDINVVPDVYTLKVGIKFVMGFQIRDLEAIKIGDQA